MPTEILLITGWLDHGMAADILLRREPDAEQEEEFPHEYEAGVFVRGLQPKPVGINYKARQGLGTVDHAACRRGHSGHADPQTFGPVGLYLGRSGIDKATGLRDWGVASCRIARTRHRWACAKTKPNADGGCREGSAVYPRARISSQRSWGDDQSLNRSIVDHPARFSAESLVEDLVLENRVKPLWKFGGQYRARDPTIC
jgi:hypothetical protein